VNPRIPVLRKKELKTDKSRNLQGATACGIRSVLVGSIGESTRALVEIESLHDLRTALPELWEYQGAQRVDPSFIIQPVSAEVRVSSN
jgi:hypothetical protein